MEKIVLWKDREKQLLDPELFSKKAEALAIIIEKDRKFAQKFNKRSQIRKFYDEVVRLNNLTKNRPEEWNNIMPMVHMLVAKTAYAHGRELISKNFMAFIKDSINQIEGPEDLNIFCNFFEAFMGFYRLYGPKS